MLSSAYVYFYSNFPIHSRGLCDSEVQNAKRFTYDGMSAEAYLRNFDNKVQDARISPHECDTFSVCSDLLTGLAQ